MIGGKASLCKGHFYAVDRNATVLFRENVVDSVNGLWPVRHGDECSAQLVGFKVLADDEFEHARGRGKMAGLFQLDWVENGPPPSTFTSRSMNHTMVP